MRSQAEAIERYQRGTNNGAQMWNAAKGRMQANWAQSVGAGPLMSARYSAGINSATYRPGDGNKWWNNWRAKMSQ